MSNHPTIDTSAAIANRICNQILEMQNAIASREEGSRYPTPQEVSQQCRLINCLDKLMKYNRKIQEEAYLETLANNELQTTIPTQLHKTQQSQPVIGELKGAPTPTPEPPTLTEDDYNTYKHLLGTFKNLTDTHTTRFRGRFVNTKWLEYNLLQYTLPTTERKFINDARLVLAAIDYKTTQEQIKKYLASKNAA